MPKKLNGRRAGEIRDSLLHVGVLTAVPALILGFLTLLGILNDDQFTPERLVTLVICVLVIVGALWLEKNGPRISKKYAELEKRESAAARPGPVSAAPRADREQLKIARGREVFESEQRRNPFQPDQPVSKIIYHEYFTSGHNDYEISISLAGADGNELWRTVIDDSHEEDAWALKSYLEDRFHCPVEEKEM